MSSFNRVILMGNLTRDPEMTYTPSQVAVCKFGLAINRRFKSKSGEDREDVLFIDCTAFDKRGETIHQYCTKGKQILIEGSLKQDSWEDKQTGQKRTKVYVIVESFQFVGGRRDDGDSQDNSEPPAKRPAGRPAARPAPQAAVEEDAGFKDDDIPF